MELSDRAGGTQRGLKCVPLSTSGPHATPIPILSLTAAGRGTRWVRGSRHFLQPPDTQLPDHPRFSPILKRAPSPQWGWWENQSWGSPCFKTQPPLVGDKEGWPGGWLVPWSEMDNGPGLSARPWPCPFTSGAQFKLDNASSGQFPSPTAATHLKGQSLLSGASACSEFNFLH